MLSCSVALALRRRCTHTKTRTLTPSHMHVFPSSSDLVRKFNISNSQSVFQQNGVCPGAGRLEMSYIQMPGGASPSPLFRDVLTAPRLLTDFSKHFCLAATIRPPDNESSPLLFFYDTTSLARVGFFAINTSQVEFQLAGQIFSYSLVPTDINADGFVQLQICFSRVGSQAELYVQCGASAAATRSFSIHSSSNVGGISIFRPVEDPTATPYQVMA